LADLERRLDGIPLWSLVGNHGLEPAVDAGSSTRATQWVDILRQRLPVVPGLIVEDKGHSLTIHYRQVEDKAGIRTVIHEAIRDLTDVRALAGIEAISVLPRHGAHKGTALQEARRQFACDTAVYVGDDETDEDAFRSSESTDLLSVRIGRTGPTAARFCLEDQSEIDAFLRALLEARDERRARRPDA
jgi:trehalose 6-phosphate phosphatase